MGMTRRAGWATAAAAIAAIASPSIAQSTPSDAQIQGYAQDLRHEDPATRSRASQKLRVLGEHAEPAVPILVLLLQNSLAGNTAAQRLIDIGPAAAIPTARVLQDGDTKSQAFRLAFTTLRRLGPRGARATDSLTALSTHAEEARRTSAIRLLGGIGDAAFPALENGFSHSLGQTRHNFAQAIGTCAIRSDAALAKLCAFAAANDLGLRQTAATYLRTLPKPRHEKRDATLLQTWLGELSSEPVEQQTRALRRSRAERLSRAIHGIEALGAAAVTTSTKTLIALLDAPEESLRLQAATVLAAAQASIAEATTAQASQKIPSLLPQLRSTYATASLRQRQWITICAGYTGEQALSFLAERLESDHEIIRWRAANALQRLGPRALPTLVSSLDSAHEETLVSSLEALGLMGKEADSCLPRIKQLFAHADSSIQSAAKRTHAIIEAYRR